MFVIGITGNSGSGKSMISELIKSQGAYIIDADKVAHKIMQVGKKAYNEIIDFFGSEVINNDKTINRKILGNIVFNDSQKLNKLNDITHKYILEYIKDEIREIKNKKSEYKYIVIDAPLLIETGLNKECDYIWIVYASIEKRLERIKKRDNISEEIVLKRFKNQTPFEVLKKFADVVIENDTSNIKPINEFIKAELKKISDV